MSLLRSILLLALCCTMTKLSYAKDFGIYLGPKYTLYIHNNLPNNSTAPLVMHCQSKDDDLGWRTLNVGEEFHWSFRVNLWQSTLFFCRMEWEQRVKTITVFTQKHEGHDCETAKNLVPIFWSVQESGFFFRCKNSAAKKKYPW